MIAAVGLAAVAALAVLVAPSAEAQYLVVEPGCGLVGSTVRITGSGWSEPDPVCEYSFRWDGTEIAPRQPDGLFGPPDATFTVPAGAALGDHEVRTNLDLLTGTPVQCVKTTFKVVAALANPWLLDTTAGNGQITITFNPTNVCDVTPCTAIVMIQTIRQKGRTSTGPDVFRDLTFAEQNFGNAANYDADVTPTGTTVDRLWGRPRPYYGSDDTGDYDNSGNADDGVQSGSPDDAWIWDRPTRSEASYPAGVDKIVLNFEVEAFCSAGQNVGESLGTAYWTWEKLETAAGKLGTATGGGSNRNEPSQAHKDAVALWDTNHATWALPTTRPPTSGGVDCP